MSSMFNRATNFNQSIGNWNTSKVTIMENMFSYATNFNQDLHSWNVSMIVYHNNFDNGAAAWVLPNSRPIFP